MAALTKSVEREVAYPGQGYVMQIKSTTADTYYKGAMLSWDGAGGVKVSADGAGTFVGICLEEVTVPASGSAMIHVLCRSRVWLPLSGAAQADVGTIKIADNDNDLADFEAAHTNIGRVVAVKTNLALIDTTW